MITPILKFQEGEKKVAHPGGDGPAPAKSAPSTPVEPPPSPGHLEWAPLDSTPEVEASAPNAPALEESPPLEFVEVSEKPEAESAPSPAVTRSSISRMARVQASADMAEAVTSGIEDFLPFFKWSINSDGSLNGLSQTDFFHQFIRDVELFVGKTSEAFAGVVRTHSARTEVRRLDSRVLATQVRASGFRDLDAILAQIVALLLEMNIDLSATLNSFPESPLRELARRHRPTPRSGEFARERLLKPDEMAASETAPWDPSQRLMLAEKQAALKTHVGELAFSFVVDYLQSMTRLPAALLDYGSAQCFGEDLDDALQRKVLLSIESALEPRITRAIELVLNLGSAQSKKLETSQEAELHKLHAVEDLQDQKAWHEIRGMGFLAFGGICLFPAWLTVLTGWSSPSLKMAIVIAGVIGCFSFFWGVTQLTYSRGLGSDAGEDDTAGSKSESPAPESGSESAPSRDRASGSDPRF